MDVNVTPDKRQILIQQERALLALTKVNELILCTSNNPVVDGIERYF